MAQALAVLADVQAIAPELTVDMINRWLPIAATLTHVPTWGEDASYAHALRTAHLATQHSAGPLGISGPVTSMANGPSSRSFAAMSISGTLGTTVYGKALELLMEANRRPGIVCNAEIAQT